MFQVLLWEIKGLGGIFFLFNTFGILKLGDRFSCCIVTPKWLCSHTHTYLFMLAAWSWHILKINSYTLLFTGSLPMCVTDWTNREKKIVLKKIIACEIAVSSKQTENPTFAWALNKIVPSQLSGIQWWCCSFCTPSLPFSWKLTAFGYSCSWNPGLGKSSVKIRTIEISWALDAPCSQQSQWENSRWFPSVRVSQYFPTKKVSVIIWLLSLHEIGSLGWYLSSHVPCVSPVVQHLCTLLSISWLGRLRIFSGVCGDF